jgi:phosphohistidine phosphatase
MKKLVLIRHSKSSWDDPFLTDHARPLSERGIQNAPEMGRRLKEKAIKPDLIICSDAVRTQETAILIATAIGYPFSKIHFSSQLYHASAAEILKSIRQVASDVEVLFVIGHNPGFNDLMWKMHGTLDNLPTTGIFAVQSAVDSWKHFEPKNTVRWFEDYPKK